MWVLQLNMMRNRTESRTLVGWAETREALQAYVDRERAPEPWQDRNGLPNDYGDATVWNKTFKPDSPLEYFNPPETQHDDAYVRVGTLDEWIEATRRDYLELRSKHPQLG